MSASSSERGKVIARVGRVIATRLGHAIFIILAVIILTFSLIHLAPGDAAEVLTFSQGGASEEQLAEIREEFNLDDPFLSQLGNYIIDAFRFDFGNSFFFQQPVSDLVLDRLWPTILLVSTALGMAIVGGVILGVYSARRPEKTSSHVMTVLALFGFSAPIFWTGIMLLLLFSSWLGWLPSNGMNSVTVGDGFFEKSWDTIKHLILPATTLGFFYMAQYSRISRATMLEVLGSDYVRTARAKGLKERVVIWKHALRNAVIPVVTIAGFQIAAILSGGILVETVFNWPGMGRLAFEALLRRDTPILMGMLIISAIIVIVANLLTDLAYRLIDPRIRYKT